MSAEPTFSGTTQPSRSSILIVGLVAAGAMASSFTYGRSVLEGNEHATFIEVAKENQNFCVDLGFRLETDAYRKCIGAFDEVRHREKRRFDLTSSSLL